MNKRKGSLFEQKSRVNPMLKFSEQSVLETYQREYLDEKYYHEQQQYQKIDDYHNRNDQPQNHDQFKLKENINKYSKRNEEYLENLKQIMKLKKQNRSQSAQRPQSLDKKGLYPMKQNFIENTLLQINHQNNSIDFQNYLDNDMQSQIYEKSEQQMINKQKRGKEQDNLKPIAESSQRINELRDNYVQQKGGIMQSQESLVNQLENQTNYQEEFENKQTFLIENEDFLEKNTSSNLIIHNRSRNQYRKAFQQTKNPIYQKQTLQNIKDIIRQQQKDMKEYLEQRTQTDTTDDQNISINPNNKSSSDEAIQTSADLKQKKYVQYGNEFQGRNYIPRNFLYSKKRPQNSKAQVVRDLSTTHDTTKQIDDESANKQQNSDKNNKSIGDNNSFQKDQEYLSEKQYPSTQQFNGVDQNIVYKPQEFDLRDSRTQTVFRNTQKQDIKRKNSPSQSSGQQQTKKNLSIISDQFEDYFDANIVSLQFCPKQSQGNQNKSFSQKNSNKNNKRSKSETNNSRINPLELMISVI